MLLKGLNDQNNPFIQRFQNTSIKGAQTKSLYNVLGLNCAQLFIVWSSFSSNWFELDLLLLLPSVSLVLALFFCKIFFFLMLFYSLV